MCLCQPRRRPVCSSNCGPRGAYLVTTPPENSCSASLGVSGPGEALRLWAAESAVREGPGSRGPESDRHARVGCLVEPQGHDVKAAPTRLAPQAQPPACRPSPASHGRKQSIQTRRTGGVAAWPETPPRRCGASAVPTPGPSLSSVKPCGGAAFASASACPRSPENPMWFCPPRARRSSLTATSGTVDNGCGEDWRISMTSSARLPRGAIGLGRSVGTCFVTAPTLLPYYQKGGP